MTRILTTLVVIGSVGLGVAFWLGWTIGDPTVRDPAVQSRVAVHFLAAVAALVFAVLVHAMVITYFMGTGRWLEETCTAYKLGDQWQQASRNLKWRLYPALTGSLVLLIATGAFGGAADPASAVAFEGFGSLSAAQVHLCVAVVTLAVNAVVNVWELIAVRRNGRLVSNVLDEVRRIRTERGLDV